MCAYNFLRRIISNYASFVLNFAASERASERAKVISTSLQNNYSSILHSRWWRREGGCITDDAMACYRFSFFFSFSLQLQYAVARELRRRRRGFECTLFATAVKSLRSGEEARFCKIKAFYSNRMYSYGGKTRESRSWRELFLLRVFFFVPLRTQPFVSSVARESLFHWWSSRTKSQSKREGYNLSKKKKKKKKPFHPSWD